MISLYHLEKFALMREAVKTLSVNSLTHSYLADSSASASFEEFALINEVDVLLLDMDLVTKFAQPLTDCFELCTKLHKDHPSLRIVLHSPYSHSGWINKFMALGVTGFVSKNSKYSEVSEAVNAVHAGELFVCPAIIEQFSNFPEFLKDRKISLKMVYAAFSPREIEVLDLLSRGLSTKDIAAKLFVSEKTVETHRKHLVEKAGVKNTAELIRFVSIRGLLQP